MKKAFLALTLAILLLSTIAITSCSSNDSTTTTLPAEQQGQPAQDDIDTSELDQIEQDLSAIDQSY